MSAEAVASWLLGIMIATIPPGRSRFPPEARETAEEGRARYALIAEAAAKVAFDEAERPVFPGERGREKTAALLLALAYHESGWRRDVDLGIGPHAHGAPAHARRRYHCLLQIAVDRGKRTPDGWTGEDLTASRERCFRAGLHLLQRARGSCKSQGPDAWLRLFTSGRCTHGRKAAEARMATYRQFLAKHGFPSLDAPRENRPAPRTSRSSGPPPRSRVGPWSHQSNR